VVDCNNRHSAGCNVSFYRFPDPVEDIERRRRWINFVSRKNEDGTPCEPAKGSRLCSKNVISGEKSDSPTSPDFVPSIYPKTAEKKPANSNAVESLARHALFPINRLIWLKKRKRKEPANLYGKHSRRLNMITEAIAKPGSSSPVRLWNKWSISTRDTTVSQFPNIPAEVGRLNDDVAL